MEDAKTRARIALTHIINDYKEDDNICQVVKEMVNMVWNIFEDEYYTVGAIQDYGKEADVKKSTHDLKRRRSARKEINCQAEKVLRSNSWRTTPQTYSKTSIKGPFC